MEKMEENKTENMKNLKGVTLEKLSLIHKFIL